jgi:hypothetical protein
LNPVIRPVPGFYSGATISMAFPRSFNSHDPRISIDNQFRETSPQSYESQPKEKTILP